MSEPRIVSPEEAQERIGDDFIPITMLAPLAHTVATEPDRTRAAVVKALLEFGYRDVVERADAISKGADL